VDAAAALGADLVSGPLYAPPGRARALDPGAREAEFARACEALREVADHAGARGVRLAVEPLNRFETDLVTTTDRALELCERVGSPQVGLLLDTFHMNIEEGDVAAAVRAAGDRLLHLHACENDRGRLGHGHVDWAGVLGEVAGFDGVVSLESFGPAAEGVRAAARWRPWFADPDEFAREGLAFLRDHCSRAARAGTTDGATTP
jgi:D-psicose/D-tagatose/L-ribulose 3-epimerase